MTYTYSLFFRHTSRGAHVSGINSLAHSAICVPPITVQKVVGHKYLSTNLLYQRENKFGSMARQAAIMNHTRNPVDKITAFDQQKVTNLSEFFK